MIVYSESQFIQIKLNLYVPQISYGLKERITGMLNLPKSLSTNYFVMATLFVGNSECEVC